MIDVAYTFAAGIIIAIGAIASRALLRDEHRAKRRPSSLRQRQIDREADESGPIGWRQ